MSTVNAVSSLTGAQALVAQLRSRGVTYIFGVPGGDCSLDIIAAAQECGVEFVLTRTENAAAMMAAAAAAVTGMLGAVLTTRGPGLANGVNGVACARLDRCSIVLISDGYENEQGFVSHQRFDQQRVLEPLVKGSLRVDSPESVTAIGPLLDLAMSRPHGPVYLEVTGKGMRGNVPAVVVDTRPGPQAPPPTLQPQAIATAADLMSKARRPVIIVGLQSREPGAAEGLRTLAARWQCPVFATYMGKGAIPDKDPLMMGHFMAGGAERETMKSADLILLYGADPIELLPKPWQYEAPVIDVTTYPFDRHHIIPAVSLIGDLASAAMQLCKGLARAPWAAPDLQSIKAGMRERATGAGQEGISPTLLSQTVCRLLPGNARIAVDAGAHMLPVMAFFEAQSPYDALISRGLATMGYALPTAIGAALAQPDRPVVALTGDGGLMMCASELATAAQLGCKLTVVVFNDSAIAMIGVKQSQRGLSRHGMDYSRSDFSLVAQGYGCEGARVQDPALLEATLQRALASAGTSLVDVIVDPSGYDQQIASLRG